MPYERAQAGGCFGPEFTSVFFFENVFWRVVIPVVFGTDVSVDTLASLVTMPACLRSRLVNLPKIRAAYKEHWRDCMDYYLGRDAVRMRFVHDEVGMEPITGLPSGFVEGLDRDLRSAIADLSQDEPNSNAMHNARMAAEKALKSFLCLRHGYTEASVKRDFGHDIDKLMAEIARMAPGSEFATLQAHVKTFASYSDRYTDMCYGRADLWNAYRFAQFAAAALMRVLFPSCRYIGEPSGP